VDRRSFGSLVATTLLAGCTGLDSRAPASSAGGTTSPTAALPGAEGDGETAAWDVTVTRVVDGDTVDVRFENGLTDRIRLLGVDTPERRGGTDPAEFEGIPDTAAGERWLARWGEAATTYATDELDGREVRVAVDSAADRRDRYGRLLAYVVADGDLFNRRLLQEGYARVYESEFSRLEAFRAAERRARERRVGLWGALAADWTPSPTATATPDGGADASSSPDATDASSGSTATGAGGLVVAAVHADAAGDDGDNLRDEYVVFENRGDAPLDLGGWRVVDAADHRYDFPADFVLDPGARVTLHTGGGTETATDLYWGASRPVWNNAGDTIRVLDAEGRVVLERSY